MANFVVRNRIRVQPGEETAPDVLPLLRPSAQGNRANLAVTVHSCVRGEFISFPVVLFAPSGKTMSLLGPRSYGVQLRVVLHIMIPLNLPVSWVGRTLLNAVFPLFGMLRRYWGRAMHLWGCVTLNGGPSSSRGHPSAYGDLRVRVCSRIPGVLRHCQVEVTVDRVYGPRSDVGLLGASLQWLGTQTTASNLHFPEEASREELRRCLWQGHYPSSIVTEDDGVRSRGGFPESMWEVTPPTGAPFRGIERSMAPVEGVVAEELIESAVRTDGSSARHIVEETDPSFNMDSVPEEPEVENRQRGRRRRRESPTGSSDSGDDDGDAAYAPSTSGEDDEGDDETSSPDSVVVEVDEAEGEESTDEGSELLGSAGSVCRSRSEGRRRRRV